MFQNFSEEARKMIKNAKAEMLKLKHPYVGSEHLLLAILKDKNSISAKLKEYSLTYEKLKEEIVKTIGYGSIESEWFLYTPVLKNVFENAIAISKDCGGEVTVDYLFMGILEEGEGIAIRILLNMGIDIDKVYQEFIIKSTKKVKKKKMLIDEIGIDFTEKARKELFDPVIGRDKELRRIMEILSRRNKNNPLLIGDAGVGKTAIVEELSRRIVAGEVPNSLLEKRVVSVDMSSLVAGTKYRGEFEEKINKLIKEIEECDDLILFIDEIHTLIGAGGAEGAIDASNILKPALARNKMHCIGATTTEEYKKYMESDKALDRRFQTVLVTEPSKLVVKDILFGLKPIYEKFHKVNISNELLETLIELTDKYIYNRKNPDKTIDILDEVCSHANLKENKSMIRYQELSKNLKKILDDKKDSILNKNFNLAMNYKEQENKIIHEMNNLEVDLANHKWTNVTKKDLEEVLNTKVDMPIYELSSKGKNKKKFVNILGKEVIGQTEVVSNLVDTYLQNQGEHKCYGVLFSGNSGVGKTVLAEKFGKVFSNHIIRLDMSEYSESHTVSKLLGSPAGYVGYNDTAHAFEEIRTNPFSVLILDEIDRAHPKVLNLFLQILDNSEIKDSKGTIIDFHNVIIIMTTNICKKKELGFQKNSTSLEELNQTFGIPFMNRIERILFFHALEEQDLIKIIDKELKSNKKYKKLHLSSKEKEEIIKKSNYKEYGARQISALLKQKYHSLELQNT